MMRGLKFFAVSLALVFAVSAPISYAGRYSVAHAADCVANNNLSETAQTFIGRCRLAGINREFPGELYQTTLGVIKAGSGANYTKAWKLLNDSRFAK
jgi:hypothetical protein